MKLNTRNGIRIFFLFLIFLLWFTGKIQMWGPLLGLGLLAIPLGGRIFCGWLCPISTSIDIFKPVIKKPLFKINKTALPNKGVQILLVILSFALLIFLNTSNFKIPFFILLIPVGILVTFLFGEVFWHRSCFVGIIYSWFGNFARKGYSLNKEECISCRACIKVCPNSCITLNAQKKAEIEKKNCLVCGKCKAACPPEIIHYETLLK